jgi:SAM-dependent methyltransferase
MKSTVSDKEPFSYEGEELELFSHALHWKRYWARQIAPFIRGEVLEVGAGNGSNTLLLASNRQERWVCLEPDGNLTAELQSKLENHDSRPTALEVVTGELKTLPPTSRFDTILYVDVLEHIGADKEELEEAYRLLRSGGHLIVLSPAHQFLYTIFDQGLGHYRRYSRRTLLAAGPHDCLVLRVFYLDSMGFFASLANRIFLKQKLPTPEQIRVWDEYLVRTSSILDPILGFNFGKTVVGIWKKH